MMEVTAEGGRVYLPKALRDRYGETFELVDRGDRLVLVPIPEDPLETLREEWADVDASVEDLSEAAEQEALDEAGR
jgi:bifunctional DNA-binding transcriptional regulator/antitoxin component of YhaV-PrlF toxin-antitoxin module